MAKPTNDNRELEDGLHDPDRHYVRGYLEKMQAHFKELKVHPETVFDEMADSMLRTVPGLPYRNPLDAGAIKVGLHWLWPLAKRVNYQVGQYENALDRYHRERADIGIAD